MDLKTKLRALSRSPQFPILTLLCEELVRRWNSERGTGGTEFEYLRSCLLRDGKIEGILALIKSIEDSNDDK
jgi:hypothetical protein